MPRYLVTVWAGLAQLELAKGDMESAWQYSQQVLDYLQGNPHFDRAQNPMRNFYVLWETLVALEKTAESDHVLILAAQVIQDYLDKTSDPAMQEMYLNQPHHKALWAAWVGEKKQLPA